MKEKPIDYDGIAKKLFRAGYQVGQYGEHLEIGKGTRLGYIDSNGLHLLYPWTSEAENIRSVLAAIGTQHRVVRRNNSGIGRRGVPSGINGGNAPTSPTLQVKGLSPDQTNIGINIDNFADMED